jgi:hypothetical protein
MVSLASGNRGIFLGDMAAALLERYVHFAGPQVGTGESRLFADIHVHTNGSDGISSPKAKVKRALRRGLSTVAITDHDTLDPSLRALDYAVAHQLAIDVLPGEEVSTREGHILALGITERILPGLRVEETIAKIRAQPGAVAIVAHPGLPALGESVPLEKVVELYEHRSDEVHPHGVELFSAGTQHLYRLPVVGDFYRFLSRGNPDFVARGYYEQGRFGDSVAVIGSTDGHGPRVGTGVSYYPMDLPFLEAVHSQLTSAAYDPAVLKVGMAFQETTIMAYAGITHSLSRIRHGLTSNEQPQAAREPAMV